MNELNYLLSGISHYSGTWSVAASESTGILEMLLVLLTFEMREGLETIIAMIRAVCNGVKLQQN